MKKPFNNVAYDALATRSRDLVYIRRVLASFFDYARSLQPHLFHAIPGDQTLGKEWTFSQTIAHVTAAAEIYQQALEDTLNRIAFVYPGLANRYDLPYLNQKEIIARQHLPLIEIIERLLQTLQNTAQITQSLTMKDLDLLVNIPLFNRPLTLAELLDMQIVHPGILHAAQLTRSMRIKPLWTNYPPDFMHRQLTRFFQLMAIVYWPERGGNLQATIKFIIAGPGGGQWYVTIKPTGGTSAEGSICHANLTIWSYHTHALCQFFMHQEHIFLALLKGQFLAWGDLRLSLKLSWLFLPA